MRGRCAQGEGRPRCAWRRGGRSGGTDGRTAPRCRAEHFGAAEWKIDFQPSLCGRGGLPPPPRLNKTPPRPGGRSRAKLRSELGTDQSAEGLRARASISSTRLRGRKQRLWDFSSILYHFIIIIIIPSAGKSGAGPGFKRGSALRGHCAGGCAGNGSSPTFLSRSGRAAGPHCRPDFQHERSDVAISYEASAARSPAPTTSRLAAGSSPVFRALSSFPAPAPAPALLTRR